MTEKEKMLAGKIYDPSNEELAEMRVKAHKLSQRYNFLYEDDNERKTIIDELIPHKGEGLFLQGPIYFDYGVFTSFGKNCYANFNFTVLDTCPVNIGDNVFFGPNCTIATPVHPFCLPSDNCIWTFQGRCRDFLYLLQPYPVLFP